MGLKLKRRTGIILASCIFTAACGEPADLVNGVGNADALVLSSNTASAPDAPEGDFIDRKPGKILSPEEKRRIAALLEIYRETDPEQSGDKALAAEALDKIDPRIMQVERRREASAGDREYDQSVDDMIREHEQRRAAGS